MWRREKEGVYKRRSLLALRSYQPWPKYRFNIWVGDALQIPSFMNLKAEELTPSRW